MLRTVVWVLTVSVVALQIPYPLVHGDARDVLTVVTVVVFALAAFVHAAGAGADRAATLVGIGVVGFAAEVVGVHTGVPFGDYRYTGGLGPSVASVPVAIALAWMMMAEPAACVAARLARRRWARVVVTAVALASWDVFLDPQMVDAHHWRWAHPDPHLPGIADVPLSNLGGWLLVSLVVALLLHRTTLPVDRPADRTVDRPMLALWVWTWLSSTLANIAFFHRPAVAAWGFAAMGLVGIPLVREAVR